MGWFSRGTQKKNSHFGGSSKKKRRNKFIPSSHNFPLHLVVSCGWPGPSRVWACLLRSRYPFLDKKGNQRDTEAHFLSRGTPVNISQSGFALETDICIPRLSRNRFAPRICQEADRWQPPRRLLPDPSSIGRLGSLKIVQPQTILVFFWRPFKPTKTDPSGCFRKAPVSVPNVPPHKVACLISLAPYMQGLLFSAIKW